MLIPYPAPEQNLDSDGTGQWLFNVRPNGRLDNVFTGEHAFTQKYPHQAGWKRAATPPSWSPPSWNLAQGGMKLGQKKKNGVIAKKYIKLNLKKTCFDLNLKWAASFQPIMHIFAPSRAINPLPPSHRSMGVYAVNGQRGVKGLKKA